MIFRVSSELASALLSKVSVIRVVLIALVFTCIANKGSAAPRCGDLLQTHESDGGALSPEDHLGLIEKRLSEAANTFDFYEIWLLNRKNREASFGHNMITNVFVRDFSKAWPMNFSHILAGDKKTWLPAPVASEEFTIRKALDKVYAAYAKQADEISSGIPSYRKEDELLRKRTIHFVSFSSGNQLMAHVQMQYSFRPEDPLNEDFEYPQASEFIHRDGPVVGVQRLLMMGPEDLALWDENGRDLLTGTENRNYVSSDLWLQVTSWIQTNLKTAHAEMLVSKSMRTVLKRAWAPLEISTEMEVQKGPDKPVEWIIKLNPDELQRLQRIMFVKKMKSLLRRFLKNPQSDLLCLDIISKFADILYQRLENPLWLPTSFDYIEKLGAPADLFGELNDLARRYSRIYEDPTPEDPRRLSRGTDRETARRLLDWLSQVKL